MTGTSFDPYRFPVRVYYEDTDFSGVVYHANYLRFLERGRTELLRELGVVQSALHRRGGGESVFAVRSMALDFRGAARMDDELVVETRIEALGGASVTMRQTVRRGTAALLVAVVRIALVGEGRARRLPGALLESLRPALAASRPGAER